MRAGKLAGGIGTLLVHAAAAAFLFESGADRRRPRRRCTRWTWWRRRPRRERKRIAARGDADAAAGEAGAGEAQAQAAAEDAAPSRSPKPPPDHGARPRAAAADPGAGHAGRGRDAEHRHRRGDDQDAGARVSIPGVSAEHREPGLPALGPRRRAAEQLRGDQFPDPARRHACTTSGSSPAPAVSRSISARRARSRRRATPARSARCPTGGTPTSSRSASTSSRQINETTSRSAAAFPLAVQPLAAQDTTRTLEDRVRIGVEYTGRSPRSGRPARRRARLGSRHRPSRPRLHRPVRDDRRRARVGRRDGRGRHEQSRELRDLQDHGRAARAWSSLPAPGGVTRAAARRQPAEGPERADPSRCRRRPIRAIGSRSTAWRTRSPGGRAARRASPPPGSCSSPTGGSTGSTATAKRSCRSRRRAQTALSPVWSPDGQRIAYTRLEAGRGGVIVQSLAGGAPQVAPGAQSRPQHHADLLARRPDARLRALRRDRHRHFRLEHRRPLLRATLDRGTLR